MASAAGSGGMARRLSMVAAALVLIASGTYVFVYLVRWEWHRALVSGMIFLAAELGIIGFIVMERLRRVEQRLDQVVAAEAAVKAELEAVTRVEDHIRAAAPPVASPFAWLERESNKLSVFVPILLGAGVVLSGLAWLVEKVARATAGPSLERGLAVDLAPFTVPSGALRAGVRSPITVVKPGHRRLPIAVALLVLVPFAAIAMDFVADATQNRPDQTDYSTAGAITLHIETKIPGLGMEQATRNLWGACVPQLGSRYELLDVQPVGAERMSVFVRPAIGKYAERRLRGCLEDATSDRLWADVVSISQ